MTLNIHSFQISPVRISTCNLHGQKVKSGVTGLISTILVRHFVSTSGHFHIPTAASAGPPGATNNTHSNTNTTGSGRSQSRRGAHTSADVHAASAAPSHDHDPHGSSSLNNSKKEDLNVLLNQKRSDGSDAGIKFKRESDYLRRGSREKDDLGTATARRSRDSDHSQHRLRNGASTTTTATTTTTTTTSERDEVGSTGGGSKPVPNVDADPWLEVGCVSLGPIIIESAAALPIPEHCLHLVQHK